MGGRINGISPADGVTPVEIRPDRYSRINRAFPILRNVVHTKTRDRLASGIGPNFPAARVEILRPRTRGL
jgi:hypothetical protein